VTYPDDLGGYEGRPSTLYRYFDADGRLLYVGITHQQHLRFQQHSLMASWWHLAQTCTLEHHPNRISAMRAETQAIINERPLYNRTGRRVFPTDLTLPIWKTMTWRPWSEVMPDLIHVLARAGWPDLQAALDAIPHGDIAPESV
jgi:hypothetical protein